MCRWCECNQRVEYNTYSGDRILSEQNIRLFIIKYGNNPNYYLACEYEHCEPDPWDSFSIDEIIDYIPIMKLGFCPVCGRSLMEKVG